MAVREVGLLPLLLNSVINPIIYTVKKQPFRIAVIELLSEKSFQEAQAFDGRLFGSKASGIVKTIRSEKTVMKVINWNTIQITTTTTVYAKCIDNISKGWLLLSIPCHKEYSQLEAGQETLCIFYCVTSSISQKNPSDAYGLYIFHRKQNRYRWLKFFI